MKDLFIVAGSAALADRTAADEWGWARLGRARWRNLDDEVVRYAGSTDELRGFGRGSVVYLASGWQANASLVRFDAHLKANGFVVRTNGRRA